METRPARAAPTPKGVSPAHVVGGRACTRHPLPLDQWEAFGTQGKQRNVPRGGEIHATPTFHCALRSALSFFVLVFFVSMRSLLPTRYSVSPFLPSRSSSFGILPADFPTRERRMKGRGLGGGGGGRREAEQVGSVSYDPPSLLSMSFLLGALFTQLPPPP